MEEQLKIAVQQKIEELEQQKKEFEQQKKEFEQQKKEFEQISMNAVIHANRELFRNIVSNTTGNTVIKATHEQMKDAFGLSVKARDHHMDVNDNIFRDKKGNPRKRCNECGNDMEKILKMTSEDKLTGFGKSAGYPDLKNDTIGYYLECKIADADQLESSFRSFYLSTLDKVTDSRAHILVCFKHREGKLLREDPIIKDLYDLKLNMKCEWNTSNKVLYSD